VQASIEINQSIAEHLGHKTLECGLPGLRLPTLFVNGEDDPLPVQSTIRTAALIPGALIETIPDCGHFPWLERPHATAPRSNGSSNESIRKASRLAHRHCGRVALGVLQITPDVIH